MSLSMNPAPWKIKGKRRRGWHRMRWVDSITDLMDINLRKLWEVVEDTEEPGMLQSMVSQCHKELDTT